MLTIEIKLNGEPIGSATVSNISDLAEVSDYYVQWSETAEPDLGIPESAGSFLIRGHRRRQTVWALAAKVVIHVLGELVRRGEAKP